MSKKSTKKVYVWGLMSHIGQKGQAEKWLEPRLVKMKWRPIQVHSSRHSFYVLTEAGEMYSWGENKYGRLGQGNEDKVMKPTKINGLKNIVSIHAQNWNAGAIDSENNVYMWGHLSNSPKPIKLEGTKARKICFGGNFLMLITTDGELFCIGSNMYLQCGVKSPSKITKLTHVLKDHKFLDVACGYNNAIAITDKNEVLIWGENKCGQICNGKKDGKRYLPRRVVITGEKDDQNPPKFVQCAFSLSEKYVHAGVVTENGVCYLWGSGYKAKLGNGKTDDSYVPVKLQKVESVSKLICGGIHNFVMDNSNNLLTFGCGSDGRLGHPECDGHRYLYKETFPRIVDPIKGKVVDASSSYYAGIALTK